MANSMKDAMSKAQSETNQQKSKAAAVPPRESVPRSKTKLGFLDEQLSARVSQV
ncbi:hypothetical protein BDD21_2083 [Thiocapsa rosea]|uniref:Uncharacterized protein n=1 Tax=Thiocapsa rosea TaxID=69360 RepID=A0A495V851_9GAMM|nr:hypothetical protein BDD21_2083 [Thiocapsa rosea]